MTSAQETSPPLDANAARRWQNLLAQNALRGQTPWLHQEVGERMAERLAWIKREPTHWVNWRAAGSGAQVHAQVMAQYPKSKCFLAPAVINAAQIAHQLIANQGWLRSTLAKIQGEPDRMQQPVSDGAVQMLWSNMSLHAEDDPAQTVKAWHRMLAVDGFLMLSSLGPDTAKELREIYADRAWGPAAHPLTDMHDWGDLLVNTGFAEPVMDMERIVLSFSSPQRALQELRGIGRNLHPQRMQGLRGRVWHTQLLKALEALRKPGGEIELTFEVIYGHAFKPAPRLKVSAESAISMRDMRAMLGQSKVRPA